MLVLLLFSDKTSTCQAKCHIPHKVYFSTTFSLLFEILVLLHGQRVWENVVNSVLHKLLQNVRLDPNMTKALCLQVLVFCSFYLCSTIL